VLPTEDPSAFPTAPPPSVDDPEVIAAHDWAAFYRAQEEILADARADPVS
jgi:hypothetical protein